MSIKPRNHCGWSADYRYYTVPPQTKNIEKNKISYLKTMGKKKEKLAKASQMLSLNGTGGNA